MKKIINLLFLYTCGAGSLYASSAASQIQLNADSLWDFLYVSTYENCLQGSYQASNKQVYTKSVNNINELVGYTCVENKSCQNPMTQSCSQACTNTQSSACKQCYATQCATPFNDDAVACQSCLQQFIAPNCALYTDPKFLLLPIGIKNAVAAQCQNWFCNGSDQPYQYILGCYYQSSPAFKSALDTAFNNYLTQAMSDPQCCNAYFNDLQLLFTPGLYLFNNSSTVNINDISSLPSVQCSTTSNSVFIQLMRQVQLTSLPATTASPIYSPVFTGSQGQQWNPCSFSQAFQKNFLPFFGVMQNLQESALVAEQDFGGMGGL